jgi:Niemann-Pick C1 protein
MTMVMGVTAVACITLLFVPSVTGAILCTLCFIFIDIELVGLITAVGYSINPLSAVLLIMSLGLVVDYCLHLVLVHSLTRQEDCPESEAKVSFAMERVGGSIFKGGLTTFLGILPLAFSATQTFFTFFVIFVGMVVLALSHGLIVAPVVLHTMDKKFGRSLKLASEVHNEPSLDFDEEIEC